MEAIVKIRDFEKKIRDRDGITVVIRERKTADIRNYRESRANHTMDISDYIKNHFDGFGNEPTGGTSVGAIRESYRRWEGFKLSVPKKDNGFSRLPLSISGTLLDRPTFRLETCATLGTVRRLVVGTIIAYYAPHSFLWRSEVLVDKEGRRSMLRCSRSASWGTLGSNRAGGDAG
jgi:hypothetical protein